MYQIQHETFSKTQHLYLGKSQSPKKSKKKDKDPKPTQSEKPTQPAGETKRESFRRMSLAYLEWKKSGQQKENLDF